MKLVNIPHATLPILSLNVLPCILGYVLWASISQFFLVQVTYHVPIVFYGKEDNMIIETSLDESCITLEGSRTALAQAELSNIAIHINAHTLKEGINSIQIERQHLMLSQSVQLLNAQPYIISVNLKHIAPHE